MSSGTPLLPALALGLSLAALTGTTGAQAPGTALEAQLAHCATIRTDRARLACYDALAPKAGSAGAPAPAAAPAPASATSAPPAPPPLAKSPPAAPAAPLAPSAPAPGSATGSSGSPSGSAPDTTEFGVRNGPLEVRREPAQPKKMLAVVSHVGTRARGELVVTLDNGQVWAQLSPAPYLLNAGESVEIDVGALGSYILWSPTHRRATKVTRIQ